MTLVLAIVVTGAVALVLHPIGARLDLARQGRSALDERHSERVVAVHPRDVTDAPRAMRIPHATPVMSRADALMVHVRVDGLAADRVAIGVVLAIEARVIAREAREGHRAFGMRTASALLGPRHPLATIQIPVQVAIPQEGILRPFAMIARRAVKGEVVILLLLTTRRADDVVVIALEAEFVTITVGCAVAPLDRVVRAR